MKKHFVIAKTIVLGLSLSACSTSVMNSNSSHANAPADNLQTPASNSNHLEGEAAVSFIKKHFPNAEIPGPVEGPFTHTISKKAGYAKCFYPAMGGQANGQVPTCDIQ